METKHCIWQPPNSYLDLILRPYSCTPRNVDFNVVTKSQVTELFHHTVDNHSRIMVIRSHQKCGLHQQTSTKLVCLASLTVTTACTSSINFCFSSSSKCMYHLASLVFPARFWIRINRIYNNTNICLINHHQPW